MQSYSIVLLDIDGTLIDDERKISTNTKCALPSLKDSKKAQKTE